MINWFFRLYW